MTFTRTSPWSLVFRNSRTFKRELHGVVSLLLMSTAQADRPATYWIPPAGDFNSPGNWSLGAPNATLDARIDNGGTVTIDSPAFQTIPYVYLGSAQNSSGTLEIKEGGSASFTTMIVGALNAIGVLNIFEGSRLTTFGGPIGSDYLGTGIATVNGPGALWDITGSEMVVGGNGIGTVRLVDDGQVSIENGNGRVQIANHPVSEGNLFFGSGGATGSLSASEIFNGEGRATVIFDHNEPFYRFNSKFTGLKTVNGYLNVRHDGLGTTVLAAAENNLAGSLTISEGTLIVNGMLMGSVRDVVVDEQIVPERNVGETFVTDRGTLGGSGLIEGMTSVSGTLSPGMSTGVLKFGSDLSLQATGVVVMELAGTLRGLNFDGIDVARNLTYGGTLHLVLRDGFEPALNQPFDLFEGFTGFDGDFTSITFSKDGYTGLFNPGMGVLTALPEPTASLLGLLGIGLLAGRRSRRDEH